MQGMGWEDGNIQTMRGGLGAQGRSLVGTSPVYRWKDNKAI